MNLQNGSANRGLHGKDTAKRFSIHDAFEEETDEVIKVYGSTVISTPMRAKARSPDDVSIRIHDQSNRAHLKYTDDTTSRDSDSLIQEYGHLSSSESYTYCWRHPKVRENWRTVLAAIALLIIGTGLIAMGAYALVEPHNGSQAAVFFVAGFICFVPGAYHVVYIWLAARGYRGFDFYHLPLFT
ncbi:transmembrane protein 134 isoform X1 [Anopheles funestus]|uniref:transmembrane protein 134 n=1 Tax=Anopheles marshallii TaxID=1521116 RepID=UPI0020C7000A|nr:transmembrane protein 134 isoform X1 [Anopheles funestus]XP_053664932.1 transmembrane protein 134 [Anopheles marshallii]